MMWLPDRPSEPVIDNWPPKSLSIYGDIDYERIPKELAMTDIERTPPADDPEVAPDVPNDPVPEAPGDDPGPLGGGTLEAPAEDLA